MNGMKWIIVVFTTIWVCSVTQATLITDAVEQNDGWTHINGAMFSSGIGGLSPTNGSTFWTTITNSTGNRGVWKLFNDTFINETLAVSCSIGALSYSSFDFANIYLFADTDEDGVYSWAERIEAGTAEYVRPSPASGEWQTWTRTYQITGSTLTAGGQSVIGKKIGFFVIGGTGSSSEYDFAFDGLTVQTIPEPTLIEDLVEQNDDWTHITGGMFSDGIGGLSPVEGSNFWITVTNDHCLCVKNTQSVGGLTNVAEVLPIKFYPTPISITNDALYKVKYKSQSHDYQEGFGLYFFCKYKVGDSYLWVNPQCFTTSEVTEWFPTEKLIKTPTNATELQLIFLYTAVGEGLLDDIFVGQVETNYLGSTRSEIQLELSSQIINSNLMGFGWEDDPWRYTDNNQAQGMTESIITNVDSIIYDMDPSVVRMFVWWPIFDPQNDLSTFSTNSDYVASLLQVLQEYQTQATNTEITLTWAFWPGCGLNVSENPCKHPADMTDFMITTLKYLIVTNGITNIKYIDPINEPPGVNLTYSPLTAASSRKTLMADYYTILGLLKTKIAQNFPSQNIKVVGGDRAEAEFYHTRKNADANVDVYSVHHYQRSYLDYLAPTYLDDFYSYFTERTSKPVFSMEFGCQDERTATRYSPVNEEYSAVLLTASQAICMLNNGIKGGSFWCFQDLYYPTNAFMDHGIIEFDGTKNPPYFAYRPFIKYIRPGAYAYQTICSDSDIVKSSLVYSDGRYLLYVLNKSHLSQQLRIQTSLSIEFTRKLSFKEEYFVEPYNTTNIFDGVSVTSEDVLDTALTLDADSLTVFIAE